MFSNDKNVETIGQLVETIKHYIGLQKEYLKLDVVDKVVRLLTAFTITLMKSHSRRAISPQLLRKLLLKTLTARKSLLRLF